MTAIISAPNVDLLVQAPFSLSTHDEGLAPQHIKLGRRKYSGDRLSYVVYPLGLYSRMDFGLYMESYNGIWYGTRKTPEVEYISVGRISPATVEVIFDAVDPHNANLLLGFEIHTYHDDTIPRFERIGGERQRIEYKSIPFRKYFRLHHEFVEAQGQAARKKVESKR